MKKVLGSFSAGLLVALTAAFLYERICSSIGARNDQSLNLHRPERPAQNMREPSVPDRFNVHGGNALPNGWL
jgi:hypothetical protein